MNQNQFLKEIKSTLQNEKDTAAIDFVSKCLNISYSGAYKKVKGITNITLDEAHILSSRLDKKIKLTSEENDTSNFPFTFYCDDIVRPPATYEQWASNIYNHSLSLEKYKGQYKVWSYQRQLSYFHLLAFPSLLYFQLFTWNRSSWSIPSSPTFSVDWFTKNYALNSLLEKINAHYVTYDSIDIWNIDLLKDIFSQITYFYKLNIFHSKEDLRLVVADCEKLVNHLKTISKNSRKMIFGKKDQNSNLSVYLNYIQSDSNIIYIKTPEFELVYDQFLKPNFIRTSDKGICEFTEKWINNTIQQSELISGSGEITRNVFFTSMEDQLQDMILQLEL